MLKSEFLEELQDLLQRNDPIALDMTLNDIAEWDSLAIMSCMAYFDKKFNLKTKISQYEKLNTISDLLALADDFITA